MPPTHTEMVEQQLPMSEEHQSFRHCLVPLSQPNKSVRNLVIFFNDELYVSTCVVFLLLPLWTFTLLYGGCKLIYIMSNSTKGWGCQKCIKYYADNRRAAKLSKLQQGDLGIAKTRIHHKDDTDLAPRLYVITVVYGTMTTAWWDEHTITRNSSYFKALLGGERELVMTDHVEDDSSKPGILDAGGENHEGSTGQTTKQTVLPCFVSQSSTSWLSNGKTRQ